MSARQADASPRRGLGWQALPRAAQLYVAAVIVGGAGVLAAYFPLTYPRPVLFATLLAAVCLTSLWKVTLPISVASDSTLSVSYAANLTTLLLLGPQHAMVVAVAGAWMQCTFKVRGRYPLYRTAFSMAAEAMTMFATGVAFGWLGGAARPFDLTVLTKPLVGAIAAYFVVNTGLVAAAIAWSTGQRLWKVWRDDFLWSGVSFTVAGTAGAVAAVVIDRGEQWKAILMVAPVYLTYRTYQVFTGRLEDQQRHERALRDEKERAEEANRLKDQFLAVVSHELRTPLNAILGWADMLRSGRVDQARHDRACEAIYDSARRQARLIDELLDVARIMSGKLRVERTTVDLNEVIRGAVEVVQPAADLKRIGIVVDADASVGVIEGDGARLQQIVWNLLSNAVKFTPEDGAIHVRVGRTGDSVELTVRDSGQGIPRDFLPSVFEPFRQADGSTTRLHGGLGLGLAIVKHLVEAHGGTVVAESDGEGRGATFVVRLPVVGLRPAQVRDSAAAGLAVPVKEAAHPAPSLAGISVLVVDDDDGSRQVVAAHLERHHAAVLTAASVPDALDMLQREHVDVLVADVAMPGEDGYSLVRKMRTLHATAATSIPAVAVTAFARDEDRRHALQAGFQLHLAKPIDPRALLDAVASLGKASAT